MPTGNVRDISVAALAQGFRASALVASVEAAAQAGERAHRARESVAVGREIAAKPFAFMSHEALVAAARRGGLAPKLCAEEIARRAAKRDAALKAHERLRVRNSEIVRLVGEGLTFAEIGERLGVTRSAVAGVAFRRGLSTPAPRPGGRRQDAATRYGFTADEFQEWGRVKAKGFNSDEAAEIIHRSRRSAPNGESR